MDSGTAFDPADSGCFSRRLPFRRLREQSTLHLQQQRDTWDLVTIPGEEDPAYENMIISAAGPGTNLGFALAFLALLIFLPINGFVTTVEGMGFSLNVGLGSFNMLPIPPMDGSKTSSRTTSLSLSRLRFRCGRCFCSFSCFPSPSNESLMQNQARESVLPSERIMALFPVFIAVGPSAWITPTSTKGLSSSYPRRGMRTFVQRVSG